MSERPTPETDAVAEKINFGVDIDFARKLERERDEAREVVRNIVRAGRVGRQWQNYAIEFLEKLEKVK